MAANVSGWCCATALAFASPLGNAAANAASAPTATAAASILRAGRTSRSCSKKKAPVAATVKLPVMVAPTMVCAYSIHAHGLSKSAENEVRWITPCASSVYPCGCCMKALVQVMKNPESQVPVHSAAVASRCRRGPRRCS